MWILPACGEELTLVQISNKTKLASGNLQTKVNQCSVVFTHTCLLDSASFFIFAETEHWFYGKDCHAVWEGWEGLRRSWPCITPTMEGFEATWRETWEQKLWINEKIESCQYCHFWWQAAISGHWAEITEILFCRRHGSVAPTSPRVTTQVSHADLSCPVSQVTQNWSEYGCFQTWQCWYIWIWQFPAVICSP